MLLLALGLGVFTACSDDRDENPTITAPTEFKVNTPSIANTTIDLANSTSIELTCSQPNYGFPANTRYHVQVALTEDMAGYVELDEASHSAKIEIDAPTLASTLTNMQLEKGKTEADFPMNIPVYLRIRANVETSTGEPVSSTEILSNVVKLNDVHLLFSLPPVNTPDHIYLTGQFCSWDWNKSVEMVQVNSATNVFWHLVYIDGSGIKFNTARAWDGNEKGFAGITVSGDLANEIVDANGNIASNNPGWYLMIVTSSVSGRDIIYDVQFNKPEVWLTGTSTGSDSWGACDPSQLFSVPEKADGEFVSPALVKPTGDGGVRAHVIIPGYEWWKTEFMVFEGKIVYRGNEGDQERVSCADGQKIYLNFSTEKGEIK